MTAAQGPDRTSTDVHAEVEDTYDVEPGTALPDLSDLVPPGGRIEDSTVELRSEYLDTDDHRLLDAGVTLRRRRGDADEGWHLKVPAGADRAEIRRPLEAADGTGAAAAVPDALAQLVDGLTAGRPLRPVATITTTRHRRRLLDAGGTPLVEVADDDVRASAAAGDGGGAGGGSAVVQHWRELEVELGAGDPDGQAELRRAIGARLLDAGARPAPGASKLARALGDVGPEPAPGPAGAAVQAYLREQVRALVAGDVDLRRGVDPVHRTRVAARRVRSTVRVFADLFAADDARRLDEELRWFAGLLGPVRDGDVQTRRHLAALEALPPEVVMGPVAARVREHLTGEGARAREVLATEMTGQRYRALLADVVRLGRRPPWDPASDRAAGPLDVVEQDARRADRKARRRLEAAVAAGGADGADVTWHRARKAAKRARYAAELAAAAGVPKMARRAARHEQVQEVLGEHQDSVVAEEVLRRLGAAGGTAGDNGFTFGVLWEAERQAARRARKRARRLVR